MGLTVCDKGKVERFFAVGQNKNLEEYCTDHGLNYKTVLEFFSKSFTLKMALRYHETEKGSLSTLQRENAMEAVEKTFAKEEEKRKRRNQLLYFYIYCHFFGHTRLPDFS